MSSIAQYLKDSALNVSGSDRAIDNPENSRIFNALKLRGIKLFPQDGSFAEATTPDLLIFSTAIENDNPDFLAGVDIPRMHRAEILALCIRSAAEKTTIAVSGSCGKTSVTAWLTETLYNRGLDPVMIGGGLSNRFASSDLAGNYQPGNGDFFVFEADESDKSLLNYNPDYTILLNIGTDHYEKDELIDMFRQFLKKVKKGAVVSRQVYDLLGEDAFENLEVFIFDDNVLNNSEPSGIMQWKMDDYSPGNAVFSKLTDGVSQKYEINLPMPGRHSGLNASAVLCMMNLLGFSGAPVIENIEDFKGVWRRSDFAGVNVNGARIYDDYAHNVEKIISCIRTAAEDGKRVIAIFQPHGFKPLEFMQKPLFDELETTLSDKDIFCMLPVYYAGGSASFAPASADVVQSYMIRGEKHYLSFESRNELQTYLQANTGNNDVILIMGARDNSLSGFAAALTQPC